MLNHYRDRLNQMKGRKQTLVADLEKKEKTKEDLFQQAIYLEECRVITQQIAENNQNRLTEKINRIVTDSIQAVFGDDYEFKMVISSKNNTVVAQPTFYKNGKEENVKVCEGGGMLAIASLALRVVLMTLLKDPAPTIVLDEPFANLGSDGGGLERGCQLLETISKKLDIAFIIITHGDNIKDIANKVFYISMKEEGNSKVVSKENVKEITQEDL